MVSEVWGFIQYDKDTPQVLKDILRSNHAQHSGSLPGAMQAQDDMDNWSQVTWSGRSPMGRKVLSDLSMGVRHDGKHPDYPGESVSGVAVNETAQRGFYWRWQEFMNADSWKDIHIDPITAKFEGTATMRG